MKIDILTLFPNMFKQVFEESIIGRAQKNKIITLNYINIRDYSENKHKSVDDYSYGGGPGMVMRPEPIYRAIENVKSEKAKVIFLTPKGNLYNQAMAKTLANEEHLILLCGHYEGVDQRIIDRYVNYEISIGDYVLTGGEISTMVIVDSVVRLLPDVLNNQESYIEESHYNGLLEYPQYTRPRVFNDMNVPDILLSGNHQRIKEWRMYQSLKHTLLRRPDLIENKILNKEEEAIVEKIKNGEENEL